MAPETLYENRPGGTIVQLRGGGSEHARYGQEYTGQFDPANLSEATREGLSAHTDGTPRHSAEDAQLALARDAHRRTALQAEAGQPNSSQSPVPGNYGELDEDAAALLVMNLVRYPEQQASVVMHEILYGGNRRKVIDAGGEYAHIAAQARIAGLLASQEPKTGQKPDVPPPVNPGDPGPSPGDPGVNAEFARRAAVALGADAIKSGASTTRSDPGPEFAGSDALGADAEASRQTDEALSERERLLAEREAQLDAYAERLRTQLENPSGGPAVTAGPVSATVPADRRSEPIAGDAQGFDGEGGPNTKGYFTNAQLDEYADQHGVEGVKGAGNRQEKLKALKAGGHEQPETPPQG